MTKNYTGNEFLICEKKKKMYICHLVSLFEIDDSFTTEVLSVYQWCNLMSL